MALYKGYWVTWFVLLVITLLMIAVGQGGSKGLLLGLLLVAMAVKASLISGTFMHLRSESLTLILIVALGILAVGVVLFAGIAPDALRLRQ